MQVAGSDERQTTLTVLLDQWITKHRIEAVGKLANKVEPPFSKSTTHRPIVTPDEESRLVLG